MSSPRKLRLFGCACARQVWDLLTEDCFRDAVEVAERFADGQASDADLAAAKRQSGAALERNGLAGVVGPPYCALGTTWSATRNPESAAMYPLWVFTEPEARGLQVAVIRDIFGNPFRQPAMEPTHLTPGVVQCARTIYGERAFSRMPALADLLEEAGCDDPDILGHCRQSRIHVPGCWLLDLILGQG